MAPSTKSDPPEKPEPTLTGRRIREAREAIKDEKGKPMSLRELARRSKVDAGVISRLETGDTQEIVATTIKKLAPHLGVPLEWLLASDADGTPPTPPTKSDVRLKVEREDIEEVDGWFSETLQELTGGRRYTKEQVQAAKRFLIWGSTKLDAGNPRKVVLGALEAAKELDGLGSEMTEGAIFRVLAENNAPPSGAEAGAREHQEALEFSEQYVRDQFKKAKKGGFTPKKREPK